MVNTQCLFTIYCIKMIIIHTFQVVIGIGFTQTNQVVTDQVVKIINDKQLQLLQKHDSTTMTWFVYTSSLQTMNMINLVVSQQTAADSTSFFFYQQQLSGSLPTSTLLSKWALITGLLIFVFFIVLSESWVKQHFNYNFIVLINLQLSSAFHIGIFTCTNTAALMRRGRYRCAVYKSSGKTEAIW